MSGDAGETNRKPQQQILLSHGAGGREMTMLIEQVFLSRYGSKNFTGDDSATLLLGSHRLAFTTDSFVVDPLFFPGGDIGRLAVAGTVNDLLTAAARPLALSASFILEEGLDIDTWRPSPPPCTGPRPKRGHHCHRRYQGGAPGARRTRLFITTAGVGLVLRPGVSGASPVPGDKIILTGSVGDHGTAVMLAREKLLDGEAISPATPRPFTELVLNLLRQLRVHAMRDPTRGGIAAALNEIARQSQVSWRSKRPLIPVKPAVAAACEALGLEVFQVACEGKMLVLSGPGGRRAGLGDHSGEPLRLGARLIGEVRAEPARTGGPPHQHRHRPPSGPPFRGPAAQDLLRKKDRAKGSDLSGNIAIRLAGGPFFENCQWPALRPRLPD